MKLLPVTGAGRGFTKDCVCTGLRKTSNNRVLGRAWPVSPSDCSTTRVTKGVLSLCSVLTSIWKFNLNYWEKVSDWLCLFFRTGPHLACYPSYGVLTLCQKSVSGAINLTGGPMAFSGLPLSWELERMIWLGIEYRLKCHDWHLWRRDRNSK